jgi:hypothetical protein
MRTKRERAARHDTCPVVTEACLATPELGGNP